MHPYIESFLPLLKYLLSIFLCLSSKKSFKETNTFFNFFLVDMVTEAVVVPTDVILDIVVVVVVSSPPFNCFHSKLQKRMKKIEIREERKKNHFFCKKLFLFLGCRKREKKQVLRNDEIKNH